MEMYKSDTPEQVLEYYANTVRKKIKTLFPENLKDHTTIIN
jgi:type I restriction enzyme M protein